MICPKCHNEVKADAKFCNQCGFSLSEAARIENKPEIPSMICAKCGAQMKSGVKFCTKCGTAVNVVIPTAETNSSVPACENCGTELKEGTKFCIKCGTPVKKEFVSQVIETSAVTEELERPVSKKVQGTNKRTEKKKAGAGTIVVIVLIMLISIAGTIGILMWQSVIPMPALIAEKMDQLSEELFSEEEAETNSQTESREEENTQTNTETAKPDLDTDALFAETDALVETAKSQMDTDAEIINVMDDLSSAVRTYVSKAEEAGDADAASDRVQDAYETYIKTVIRHKNMMNASTLSGAVYAQIMSELDTAVALGEEMAQKGYLTDTFDLEIERKVFDESYRERLVNTFDEFTTRDVWSRTEAWNLMRDTADNMFDSSDLDNPIRLRYCYALAWWTQKQIETELASGTITQKGAAIKIADLIEAMDYNPMMIDYYIQYMSAAGEDCQAVVSAYDEIVEQLVETQGTELGRDIDLAHFWYFNDITAPAAGVKDGSVNGVTPENREWVRSRMKSVIFEK